MSTDELTHLEQLAALDELTARIARWSAERHPWEPQQQASALLRRVQQRTDTLRVRLESPVLVATFGGTGTGKSSLVNAIVGEECTPSGRQRPTTRKPVLITHLRTELEGLGLPLEMFDVVRREAEILRDIVLVDCPDPDTSDTATAGSNLDLLRHVLPFCDVLIYTSTQQKYRSARVVDELMEAAAGCRLVFVQTHADLDEDIRADWRAHLSDRYEIPDMFCVDSLRGLDEQRAGRRPSGDLGRLVDLLTRQLASSERAGLRRANLLDLLQGGLTRGCRLVAERWEEIAQLRQALEAQQQSARRQLADALQRELLTNRSLWERRLLASVVDAWGLSPFSAMLRIYHGLGAVLASFTLLRARNSAQIALLGAVQGYRWIEGRRQEQAADAALDRASLLGLGDDVLREAQLVIAGHVRAAHLDPQTVPVRSLARLREDAAAVEHRFLGEAGREIDHIILQLTSRSSRLTVRSVYELLFLAYVAFVLYRVGKNFFFDSFVHQEEILSMEFYVPAGLFFLLWTGLLVMGFLRRLRRGLSQRIRELATRLADQRVDDSMFPELSAACEQTRASRDRLEQLADQVSLLRREITAAPGLGGLRTARERASAGT
jgi:hypothetical protein